jgi:hypothetical protein
MYCVNTKNGSQCKMEGKGCITINVIWQPHGKNLALTPNRRDLEAEEWIPCHVLLNFLV